MHSMCARAPYTAGSSNAPDGAGNPWLLRLQVLKGGSRAGSAWRFRGQWKKGSNRPVLAAGGCPRTCSAAGSACASWAHRSCPGRRAAAAVPSCGSVLKERAHLARVVTARNFEGGGGGGLQKGPRFERHCGTVMAESTALCAKVLDESLSQRSTCYVTAS